MDVFETFEHAGLICELHYDEDPTSPSDWDTLGTLYGFGPHYTVTEKADGNARTIMDRRGVAGLVRYLRLIEGLYVLPYDILEHGTQTLQEASESDDYCTGYIAADQASIEMTGVPLDKVYEGLRAELGEWRAYFEDRVIGYVVRDPRGAVVDSCWGFYPDGSNDEYEYVRQEAREAAEYEAEQRARWARADVATA